MQNLVKWGVRLVICLSMSLSHIQIAIAQNVTKDINDKTRLSLSEQYFRELKIKEAQLERLQWDYTELQLEQRIENKGLGFRLDPESFTYILLSGVVIGYLIRRP